MPGPDEPAPPAGGSSRRAPGNRDPANAAARVPARLGWLQQLGKAWTGWWWRWFCRLRVIGVQHLPASGPVIVAANHVSMLDVPLVVVACPRPVAFMAHRGLFRGRVLSSAMRALGGYPVDPERRRDTGALGFGIAVLEGGGVLGLFPEGTRSRGRPMGEFLPGAAWLSLRTGAPVIPCGIVGTEPPRGTGLCPWLRRRRIRIAFGPPILPAGAGGRTRGRERVEALTAEVRTAVAALAIR